ncbi:inter-alpha-trypsin inhibitor heavy chain H3-like [Chanos chanos]|uniref:Inter-alpha-trypsin inhibitor heavy chain H3 n=1 Tax=Chanos chanos TaxID=29144 RepID=A0A6J2VQ78_CHACN|nr:inter-alpha-trypsin inhibitor heavy chain H3-like [Chanos chanos]
MALVWIMLLFCVCICVCVPAGYDGAPVISNHSEQELEVVSMRIDCKVASRFAHTIVTTVALNKANMSKEAFFDMELPKTAFITNFTMETEGRVYVGEVKEKEKAKKQYEKAVSTGQTAGLVKASGRKMEMFSMSVNVAANSNVTFVLTYEELLQRRLGTYEMMIRVKPKELVQHFEIVADVYEPQGITFLDVNATFITNELLPLVQKTVTDKKAHVSFCPTLEQQKTCPDCANTLIDGDFFIKYDVNRAERLGDIQIVNGYFVHFFAPDDLAKIPKSVVFVLDVSTSMKGTKIQQTQEALETILNDLHEEDYFTLVLFDNTVDPWSPSLKKATQENVEEAKDFVKTMQAEGGTDINSAVMKAVEILINDTKNNLLPEESASMVVLLTDGNPTHGETNRQRIQENVHHAINGTMSLFCLGYGYNLDYGFLDAMARQNNGLARRIYEASDAALQLQGFYDEVASPLLLEVDMHYPENMVNSLTESHFKQLFSGSEIVVAGRLIDTKMNGFLIEVSAQGVDEEFTVHGWASATEWDIIYTEDEYIFGDITERLWAYLTIQQLLDKRDIGTPEERENFTAEALDLSLRYSFVTPLTTMVINNPQTDKQGDYMLIADKLTEDQRQPTSQGYYAPPTPQLTQHSNRYSQSINFADGDPHIIVELPEQNDALCFNVDSTPGSIFNLLRDPKSGIFVNGQTIENKKADRGSQVNTYFGRFGIIHENLGVKLMVSTKEIVISESDEQIKLVWSDTASIKGPNMDVRLTKDRTLTVTLRNSVKFVIILHKVWEKHPYHQDFLGFYTLDSHLLSPSVHGLLGQFYHGVKFEVSDLYEGQDPDKPDATMFVKGHELRVNRGWRRDFRHDIKNGENVPCWFIHNNGKGVIDGTVSDYIVSGLFKTI